MIFLNLTTYYVTITHIDGPIYIKLLTQKILTFYGFIIYCWLHDDEVPLLLKQTGTTVYCRRSPAQDAQDELFQAMRTNYLAQLKRAPSVIQWCWSLL